ncbi:hypothetical protein PR202_gb01164 [Eleusine coracana subsp. coracana]|uniref:Uncharacterized protein n=1 Tax=Eleusine coracana subsp. coracana TaxID=191504 RepID=A0AAV5DV83_ELECO|nr:hypothetical protein PR202_gb01164 [Eleusine coracana subsp. coracana]
MRTPPPAPVAAPTSSRHGRLPHHPSRRIPRLPAAAAAFLLPRPLPPPPSRGPSPAPAASSAAVAASFSVAASSSAAAVNSSCPGRLLHRRRGDPPAPAASPPPPAVSCRPGRHPCRRPVSSRPARLACLRPPARLGRERGCSIFALRARCRPNRSLEWVSRWRRDFVIFDPFWVFGHRMGMALEIALRGGGFVYSKSLQIPKDIKIPVDSIGCNCTGDCSTSRNCLCAKLNGSDLPYVSTQKKMVGQNDSKHNIVGRLVEPKAVVFECGTNCSCHCSCVNRTSQQGLKYHLEVFKTESKGWGVRTWDTILPGALICEYTGMLRRTAEVEGVLENNYIFDIDCLQTIKGLDGREQRAGSELQLVSLRSEQDSEGSVAPEYCIDAGSTGNVARLAKIMLFAADTIPPLQLIISLLQELSYDYGYRLDSVTGADGNVVKLACHCGAPDCRKRLY